MALDKEVSVDKEEGASVENTLEGLVALDMEIKVVMAVTEVMVDMAADNLVVNNKNLS